LPQVRVLIADDFEAWRDQVRLILARRADLAIVGEARDGVEAIQKAHELQPDLILLDVSMPRLNGIEAARQMREVALKSLILFLTLQCSSDIAQEAMNAGAQGYLIKTDAESELLPAIEALLQGGQFISSRLKG
jgi:DNA-binding NarL/FixJ family response regulator